MLQEKYWNCTPWKWTGLCR